MVGLLEIRDSVQKISEAISSVLDVDVIISDAQFRKIGDTKRHFNLEVTEIRDTYIIGNVLKTGKTTVIASKSESPQCVACKEQHECNLRAMICVPIERDSDRIGAIGLIAITELARKKLLENQTNLIEFTKRMGDLIVSKLQEKEVTLKLTVAKNQLTSIIDSIEEGIAAVDERGHIVHANSIIEGMLNVSRDTLIGQDIRNFFRENCIDALLHAGTEFTNIEFRIEYPAQTVHALMSGKPVVLGEMNVCCFLKMLFLV
jgi:transcriptional regulator with PAS, ATPase and Fis domain